MTRRANVDLGPIDAIAWGFEDVLACPPTESQPMPDGNPPIWQPMPKVVPLIHQIVHNFNGPQLLVTDAESSVVQPFLKKYYLGTIFSRQRQFTRDVLARRGILPPAPRAYDMARRDFHVAHPDGLLVVASSLDHAMAARQAGAQLMIMGVMEDDPDVADLEPQYVATTYADVNITNYMHRWSGERG